MGAQVASSSNAVTSSTSATSSTIAAATSTNTATSSTTAAADSDEGRPRSLSVSERMALLRRGMFLVVETAVEEALILSQPAVQLCTLAYCPALMYGCQRLPVCSLCAPCVLPAF